MLRFKQWSITRVYKTFDWQVRGMSRCGGSELVVVMLIEFIGWRFPDDWILRHN